MLVTHELRWIFRVRLRRSAWNCASAGSKSAALASASSAASAKASSMDVFAPCPWCGSIPWAASPRMTTRPRYQRSSGRTPNSDHRMGLEAARIISVTAGCQPRNEATGTSSPTSMIDASCSQIFGCLHDGEEVDVLAVAADGVVQHVCVRAHPELDGVRVRQRRQVLDGHDSAEGARAGVDGVVGAGDPAPDGGAHAVGADDEVGFLGAPVGELRDDAVALLDDVDQPGSQVQVLAAESAAEDLLQVRAVDPVVGRAEALHVPVVLGHRVGRDPLAGPPVPVDELGRDGAHGVELIEQTQAGELAGGVGGHGDRGADFGEFRRLFENVRRHPPLAQGEGEGQAPDPAADDQNARL